MCPCLVDDFEAQLFAAWTSAPDLAFNMRKNQPSHFLTNLSFMSLRGITIQPAGSLRSTTWTWRCAASQNENIFASESHLNFLKVIEISSPSYRYPKKTNIDHLRFSQWGWCSPCWSVAFIKFVICVDGHLAHCCLASKLLNLSWIFLWFQNKIYHLNVHQMGQLAIRLPVCFTTVIKPLVNWIP